MAESTKFAILEKDGVEFDTPVEYSLQGVDVLPIDIIESGETYTIPENRHHVVASKMTISGTINIKGKLGVL